METRETRETRESDPAGLHLPPTMERGVLGELQQGLDAVGAYVGPAHTEPGTLRTESLSAALQSSP